MRSERLGDHIKMESLKKIIGKIRSLYYKPRYKHVRNVIWFVILTLLIHYSYRFWANTLHYFPIRDFMSSVHQTMINWVIGQSVWVNQHLLGINMKLMGHTMHFLNGSGISINSSCSGDKQILQFAILMLIYPGPWKHKLWYIPIGMVILHMTNILRIVLLSIVATNKPQWMDIAHDTALRGMFYVVIFTLWVIWEEKVRVRSEE